MTVYIAEKPDIATAMAAYLWGDYSSYKHKHCYQKGDVVVTWAYGHIMMTAMPEAYGKEYADFSTYPVIPSTWKKRPSPSTKEQFEYIRSILAKADIVVNGVTRTGKANFLLTRYWSMSAIKERCAVFLSMPRTLTA